MTVTQSYLIGGFLNFAGPITLLALLFWLNSLWTVFGPFHHHLRTHWRLWLAGTLLTGAVFMSTHVDFKVLSDETNLLSVANMLTLMGKASNTEMWQQFYFNFHALDVSVPSRPILFPVFVSLVQMAVGLKSWAPFVVNFFFLVLLFVMVWRWAERELPARLLPRTAAALALLMSPVLSIVSTSAGFDLCSLALGFSVFLILCEYERRKDSATLECLLFGLICFASVRYESIMALPFTGAGLCLLEGRGDVKAGCKSLLQKTSPQTLVMASLMILPLIVQRVLTWGSFENPPDMPPFSLWHAVKYLPVFLHSFFIEGNGPYPILMHWLGVGGLVMALRRMKSVGMIPLVFMSFTLLLLLSHHFGRADHPTQVRLFLPVSFALCMLAVYFLQDLERYVDTRYLLMIFVVLCYHHRQYAELDPLTAQLTMTREVRHIRDFLAVESQPGDLFVYDRPGQLSALGLSSVSWDRFKNERKTYLDNIRTALFTRMIMIDRPLYKPKNPGDFSVDQPGYHLVVMREHQLTPEEKLRISRVELTPEPVAAKPAPELLNPPDIGPKNPHPTEKPPVHPRH